MTTSADVTEKKMDADEVFESLTGFEEIAIEKAFGADIFELQPKPGKFIRALVFVLFKREGDKDTAAKERAMSMTFRQCMDMFPDEEDEPMPEEPVTEVGKDDEQPD